MWASQGSGGVRIKRNVYTTVYLLCADVLLSQAFLVGPVGRTERHGAVGSCSKRGSCAWATSKTVRCAFEYEGGEVQPNGIAGAPVDLLKAGQWNSAASGGDWAAPSDQPQWRNEDRRRNREVLGGGGLSLDYFAGIRSRCVTCLLHSISQIYAKKNSTLMILVAFTPLA